MEILGLMKLRMKPYAGDVITDNLDKVKSSMMYSYSFVDVPQLLLLVVLAVVVRGRFETATGYFAELGRLDSMSDCHCS